MTKREVLEFIKRERLVPVIRADKTDDARRAVEVLSSCGIRVYEITLTVPNAVELIAELKDADGVLIGAGTVTNESQAAECVAAGARFIVSPAFDAAVVEFCRRREIAVLPGTLTPTEVLTAHNAGADCVKVFPCDALGGAKYLKTLKTLFPHVEMMPTGGVSLETVADFLRAGAFAVGVGTDLVDLEAMRTGNAAAVADQARKYLEIVRNI